MKQVDRKGVRIILDNDLCVSCGACIHICAYGNVQMVLNNARGKWDPSIRNSEICMRCGENPVCLSVCPSYDINYMEIAQSHENHLLGRIRNVYNGYSKDKLLRFTSSSGGFIRELCKTLVEKKRIEGAISITHELGLEYFPHIITDYREMNNSIYHNVNFEKAISLIKNSRGKYILIGLPCQMTGITLYLKMTKEPQLKERIYGKVSLICGYTFDRKNIQAFAHYYDFPIIEVSYREGGRFRKTRLKNEFQEMLIEAKNPKHLKDRINNMIFFDRFLVQTACLYCVDHLGYCTDLTVGDAWQKRFSHDAIGTNIIISRTEVGDEIISQMDSFHFEKGYKEEIIESQSNDYALGTIGEGIKRIHLRGHYYYPNRKRTDNLKDVMTYQFKTKDLIKIKIVKKLLKNGHYLMTKWIYLLLEGKTFFFRLLGK